MHEPNWQIVVRHPQTWAPLHVLREYEALTITRRASQPDTFTIRIQAGHAAEDLLTTVGNVIEAHRDGVQELAALTEEVQYSPDGRDGSEHWTLTGRDLVSVVLDDHIALPDPDLSDGATTFGAATDDQLNVAASVAMLYYASANLIDCAEEARRVAWFRAGEARTPAAQSGGQTMPYLVSASVGETVSRSARMEPLLQVWQELAQAGGVSWSCRADFTAGLVYADIWAAADRTPGNAGGYPIVTLSPGAGTLRDLTYRDSRTKARTTLYIGGAGYLDSRVVVVTGGRYLRVWREDLGAWIDPGGPFAFIQESWHPLTVAGGGSEYIPTVSTADYNRYGRREAFLDAGNVTDAAALASLAASWLADNADGQSIDGEAIGDGLSRYGLDWRVGDRLWFEHRPRRIHGAATVQEVTITLTPREPERVIVKAGARPRRPSSSVRDVQRATLQSGAR